MKKVGILSIQYVRNYGSFLQAFALKKTIEKMGHECEFIDIQPGIVFPEYRRTWSFLGKKAIDRFAHWDILKRLQLVKQLNRRFDREFFPKLGKDTHTITHFDTVVIGSDEVFNFAQNTYYGFTDQLYGRIDNANRVISYAGSFGNTTMKEIQRHNLEERLKEDFSNMSAISVRDKNSFDIITQLTGKNPLTHIDPVLMFDFSAYTVQPEEKDYIIIYTYPNRIKKKEEVKAIRDFARKHHKRLFSIGNYFSWVDRTIIPTPFEVLGYMRNADFIITDTFHGCIMALAFGTRFATIIRKSNQQKLSSLLSQFHQENHIAHNPSEIETKAMIPINKNLLSSAIDKERSKSIEYLEKNL